MTAQITNTKVNFSYNRFYGLNQMFNTELDNYGIEHNCITPAFHVAKCFLADMAQKAYTNETYRELASNWMTGASTLTLISLLEEVGYNANNLCEFNAFSLLDTVAIQGTC